MIDGHFMVVLVAVLDFVLLIDPTSLSIDKLKCKVSRSHCRKEIRVRTALLLLHCFIAWLLGCLSMLNDVGFFIFLLFVFSKDTYAPANLSFAFAVRSRLAVTSSAFDFGEEERERGRNRSNKERNDVL
jgi:hypothetical protein